MPNDTDDTERAGVYLSGYRVTRDVGIFREQSTSDFGVDAQVEFKEDGEPTGQLVGLQIKTGPSYLSEPESDPDGWRFRPKPRHIAYWIRHALPMYLLLVDLNDEMIYWQELSADKFVTGPNGGIYVNVPISQKLETARSVWLAAGESFASDARSNFEDNLTRLSPTTIRAVMSLAETDRNVAALLAARFARGRAAPEFVVRSLLDNEPAWLSAAGAGVGLAAVAEYAHSHTLTALAVEALVRAADRDPTSAEKRLRIAGLLLVDDDRERSKALLTRARAMPGGDEDVHLEIGLAIAEHPLGDASPVALPADLRARLEFIADDAFVLSFLATQAQRVGDLDTAIGRFDRALQLEPDSAALMSALAEGLARRARTPGARPRDRERSIEWAAKAVDQLHDWSGPTQSALATLLQAQMSAGQFAGALDRALPSPDGRALPNEGARPEVQATAAVAAHVLARPDLAQRILDSMPAGPDHDFAVARMRQGSNEQQIAAWLLVLERIDESQPEALLMAVMGLSELGVDKSDMLAGLVARNIVPPSMQTLAAQSAAAVHSLDEMLPALRVSAESDEAAAHRLVQLLMNAQRYADAEAAASAAHTRFRAVEFALSRVMALSRLDDGTDVEPLLQAIVSDPTLDPLNRQSAHRQLAQVLTMRSSNVDPSHRHELWEQVERHLIECVYAPDVPVEERDIWLLIDAQVRLNRYSDALATFDTLRPAITTSGEARLWLGIVQQRPVEEADFVRMLDLAEEFAVDVQLSAGLLAFATTRSRDETDEVASPLDQRVILDGTIRARAFSLLREHVERHGEASPIQVIAAETPQGLISLMTEVVRRNNAPLIELVEMVRQARLPFGFLSLWVKRPYSSSIAERPLGYTLAGAAIEVDADNDEDALAIALNGDVVVDISTLMVASELAEFDNFRGQFRRLLMTEACKRDIVRGRSELDGRSSSSGYLGYDEITDSIVASQLDVEDLLATLQRFSRIEAASNAPTVVPDAPLALLGEIEIEGADAWLGPIALAKYATVALWSDDVAQRRLAHAVGVPAFGTLTLQQFRTQQRFERADIDDAELEDLLAVVQREVALQLEARIVDVRADPATVIKVASEHQWADWVALLTVGRPGWWHMSPNAFFELQSILAGVSEDAGRSDSWRLHAMWGAVRVAEGEPVRQATLLAAVAMLSTSGEPDVEDVVQQLYVANQTATQARVDDAPTAHLDAAAALLRQAQVWCPSTDYLTAVLNRLPEPPDSRS